MNAVLRKVCARIDEADARLHAAWRSSLLERRLLSRCVPLEGDDAAALVDSAWLLRIVERSFELTLAAWRYSSTRRWLEAVCPPAQPADAWVAIAGWIALGASTAHIALIGFDRLFGATGAGVGWLALFGMALVCISRPAAVAASLRRRSSSPPPSALPPPPNDQL